jgi:3-hydroxyisobutyrate dehydrogenase-like beta-hydroxyacid dehydrogenase
MLLRNVPRVIAGDFSPATPVSVILKDIGLAHAEAGGADVELRLGAVAHELFAEAADRGLADLDMAAIVQLWEEST